MPIYLRRDRPSQNLFVTLFIGIVVTINAVPLIILATQFFLGPTVADAFQAVRVQLFSAQSLRFVWPYIAAADVIVVVLQWPLLSALRKTDRGGTLSREELNGAMRALNRSQPAVYVLNLVAFVAAAALQVALAPVAELAPPTRSWFLVEAVAAGMMAASVMTLQLDWILFPARRRFMAMGPDITPRFCSLHARMFRAMIALVSFAIVQSLASLAVFAQMGEMAEMASMAGAARPRAGFMGPADLLSSARAFASFGPAMAVVLVRVAVFIGLAIDLLMLLRILYMAPVSLIEKSVDALVDDSGTHLRSIDIVNNDEFTALFRKINRLIERQATRIQTGERRLEAVVTGAADPIVSFLDDGTVTVANRAAMDLFGLYRDPDGSWHLADGTTASVNAFIRVPEGLHPGSDRERFTDHLAHDGPGLTRLTGVRHDGSSVPVETNYSRVAIDRELNHTLILRDISAQNEAEERLRQAREAAERANAMKSEFLANMSHELRTPLNAVLGFAQLLSRDASTTDTQREKLAIISRSGEHLLGLINDILDISKIEAGKFEVDAAPFDLKGLARDLTDMFSLRAEKKGLVLDVELLDGLPEYVVGDLGKVRQVLINLLGNAVKFTDSGGISLIIGPDAGGAPGAHATDESRVRFAVRDTGRGIPEGEVERILQPFTQSAAADHEGGTGLGLAISSRFVTLMGGTLDVESVVGEGSVFSFAIDLEPASEATATGVAGISMTRVAGGRHPRALIVDDKRYNRLVLKEILEPTGFVVMEAENGQEALDRAVDFAPDIILMDIRMPVLDGYAATASLRAQDATRSIPILALTASAFRHDEELILASGFDGYLAKPFQVARILELISTHAGIVFESDVEGAPRPDADGAPAAPLDAAALGPIAAALPDGFIARLDDAALINDFAAVEQLGAEVEAGRTVALGRRIRELARAYDETGIQELISTLRSAEGGA